jgi:hypothetical protein
LLGYDQNVSYLKNIDQTTAALIDHLKSDFQIALFIRRAGIYQIAGFTNDHDRLTRTMRQTISRLKPVDELDNVVASIPASIEYMTDVLRSFDRFGEERFQALVIVGDFSSREKTTKEPNDGLPLFHLAPDAPPAVIQKLGKELNNLPTEMMRAGICLGTDYDEKITIGDNHGNQCTFLPPLRPAEEDLLLCDQSDIVANRRPRLQTISMDINGKEKENFIRLYSDKLKDDFKVSIKIDAAEPIRAKARLRGRSSLRCARKSFSINLNGGVLRNLGDTMISDKFHLITTCSKAEGFRQYTANIIARQLGLFPLSFQFVELIVNRKSWGVYLLINNVKDGLLATSAMPTTVLRRRYDWEKRYATVKVPASQTIEDQEFSDYRDLINPPEHLSGEQLYRWVDTRMDLPKFLDLIALQTALANGDWIDEVYFFSEQAFLDNDFGNYYHVSTWDMDDLFEECHYKGKHERPDPNLLTYCLEGELEKRLISDPYIYKLYIQRLEKLLDSTLNHSSVKTALDTTFQDLTPFLTESSVKHNIRNQLELFYDEYLKREQVLRERIEKFRAVH